MVEKVTRKDLEDDTFDSSLKLDDEDESDDSPETENIEFLLVKNT